MTEQVTEALSSATFVLEKEETTEKKSFSDCDDDASISLLEDEGFPGHTGRKLLLFKLVTQQMDRVRKAAAVNLQRLHVGSFSLQIGSCKKPLTYGVGGSKFISKYSESEESLRNGETNCIGTPFSSTTSLKHPSVDETIPAISVTAREKYKRNLVQTLCDVLDEMDDEKLQELQSKADSLSSDRARKPWTIRHRQTNEDNRSLDLDFDPVQSPSQLHIKSDITADNSYDVLEESKNSQSSFQYTFRQGVALIIVMMTVLAIFTYSSSYFLIPFSFLPNGLSRRADGFCWPWNLLGSVHGRALFKGLLFYTETDSNVYINTDVDDGDDDDYYYYD